MKRTLIRAVWMAALASASLPAHAETSTAEYCRDQAHVADMMARARLAGVTREQAIMMIQRGRERDPAEYVDAVATVESLYGIPLYNIGKPEEWESMVLKSCRKQYGAK